jgi:hypothetical protein
MPEFGAWDGDYDKDFYEARLASGEVTLCYPNAGLMCEVRGDHRRFSPEDNIAVRKLEDQSPAAITRWLSQSSHKR